MQTPIYRRRGFTRPSLFGVLVILMLGALAVAMPLYSGRSKSKSAAKTKTARSHAATKAAVKTSLRSMLTNPVQETIETFAADCTTPRTVFYNGETVCAKTDNVDLNYPGGRWVDWILTGSPNTIVSGSRTTTLITQNPQTFTYAPSTNGTYKVEITQDLNGQDDPQTPAVFTVIDQPPIATYGWDTNTQTCTFPRSNFVLGEWVCVKVEGVPVNTTFPYKIAWADPAGLIRQKANIDSNPDSDSYELPSTQTSLVFGGITVDNRGTWLVNSTTNNGRLVNTAQFSVSDPTAAAANLFVQKFVGSEDAVGPGGSAAVLVVLGSKGPDTAHNVNLVDTAPSGATINSFTQQSGPTCVETTPGSGNCTIAALTSGGRAEFKVIYDMGTGTGTFPTSATVSADEADPDASDNTSSANVLVQTGGGGGTQECSVGCPDDITTPANTVDQSNNSGAIVHFSEPTGNSECGTITVDHCNDCFFPEGTTTVTATAATGDFCSFTVTVTPAGSAPTISCPGNKTGTANSSCQATFALGTAAATGTNVTVVAYRNDGKPVYTCDAFGNCTRNSSDPPFNVGVTTVTWYAYAHDVPGPYTGPVDGNGDPVNPADTEEGHRNGSATCVQTVTVNDVTPPTIAATSQTIAADASCGAVVPDYSNTVSDNCACSASDNSEECQTHNDIAYSQTPAAGTPVGLGSYTIHIEANDGTNNATKDITLTVADQTAPQISCPANVTANTASGTCSATVNPGTASATDNCDTTPTIVGTRSDNQPLNATYPKGTTTIHWTATDDAGNSSSCDQTITVEDHEAPTISCPSNIVLEPTCPSGAIATYTAPVGQDNCPGATTTRTAGDASGTVFPIGTTTVTYSVTDASGNGPVSCSFTVTVKSVLQTLDDLRASVAANTQLNGTQRNGLLSKLDAAKQHIQNNNQNGACSKLSDFVNSVQNFISHGDLSASTGNAWISTANHIRNAIGCTNLGCS